MLIFDWNTRAEVQLVGRMNRVESNRHSDSPCTERGAASLPAPHVSVDLGAVVVVVLKTPVPRSRYVVDDHSAGFPIFACRIGSDQKFTLTLARSA